MNISPAVAADAPAIAVLVRQYESLLVVDPEHAAPFWESMSEQAHRANLASPRFAYFAARVEERLVGYLAMRDGTHLFNLFVQPSWLRRGIATALWKLALQRVPAAGTAGITVNASLNAVPVYLALGFKEVGAKGQQHGIAFVPMLYSVTSDGA